jgi:hypothetical protein
LPPAASVVVPRLGAVSTRLKCAECQEDITVRKDGMLRVHWLENGDVCPGGAEPTLKNIAAKAHRYLAQGRVKVVRAESGDCEVEVYGSKPEPYRVRLIGDVWSCPCEARTWRCTHVVAAALVIPEHLAVPGFGDDGDATLDAFLAMEPEPAVVKNYEDFPEPEDEPDWAAFDE